MARPIANEEDWKRRLSECAQRVASAREYLADEIESRDQLIRDGAEAGWHQSQLAKWAGVSRSSVFTILTNEPRVA